jgi:hypothetical protein
MLIHLPAGKRNLGLMVGDMRCPTGQDEIETAFPRVDEDKHSCPQTAISGFLIGLIARPRIWDHLELGFKPGFWSVKATLKEVEVETMQIPICHVAEDPPGIASLLSTSNFLHYTRFDAGNKIPPVSALQVFLH